MLERGRRGEIQEFLADPGAGGDFAIGEADDLAVAEDRLAGFERGERNLVGLGDEFAGGKTAGEGNRPARRHRGRR